MTREEFSEMRRQIAKTQKQTAQLLGISLKAVQSFEQGWRNIPVHIERQLLFLVALRKARTQGKHPSCWDIRHCSQETRAKCPSWELQTEQFCWLINGTICHGEVQKNWQKKMVKCRKCEVFQTLFAGP